MWPDGEPGVSYRLISGFSGYAVGNDGSVWTRYTISGKYPDGWRRLATYRRPYGSRYVVACLRLNDGKGKVTCRYVHRLVAEAFIGSCPADGLLVCHNDGNTSNNHAGNLRWDTYAGNAADRILHGTNGVKLTADAVLLIRESGLSPSELAKRFGVHSSTVHKIRRGQCWKHLTVGEPAHA